MRNNIRIMKRTNSVNLDSSYAPLRREIYPESRAMSGSGCGFLDIPSWGASKEKRRSSTSRGKQSDMAVTTFVGDIVVRKVREGGEEEGDVEDVCTLTD